MNWCKIIGHKWEHYNKDIKYEHPNPPYSSFMINSYFRYCPKCFTNQIRVSWTGEQITDWTNTELSVEQIRERKLKELWI